jgi:diguanylate cyclase (GGDEF)-like protein
MHSNAPRVLLVSTDRQLLRQLSAVLARSGYEAQPAADPQHAETALAVDPPELLILDVATTRPRDLKLLQARSMQEGRKPPYCVLLVDDPTSKDVLRGLESGANDFVGKPVRYGELLARLRQGVRFIRCERELLEQVGRDQAAGLPGSAVLGQRLRQALARDGDKRPRVAVAVVELDFFAQIQSLYGVAAGNEVRKSAAETLQRAAGDSATVWRLGSGRFGVLLPGASIDEAVAWAEKARQELGEMETAVEPQTMRITASFGVTDCDVESPDADEIVRRAFNALRRAKMSGHDCVEPWDESTEEADSHDSSTPVRFLRNSVARDIFSPCPLVLHQDDALPDGAAMLQRVQLPGLPVVDGQGSFVGLLAREAIAQSPAAETGKKVGDRLTRNVPTFEEDAEFIALVEHFARDRESIAVVLRSGRPTGLLTADHLVAPVSEAGREACGTDKPGEGGESLPTANAAAGAAGMC